MSSFGLTIPATLVLAVILLVLVLRAVRRGEYDDWEGPAARHYLDADACPERDAERVHDSEPRPPTQDGGTT
jgi:cbb3-type cytochrome oxidase maturation protein